MIGQTISHYKIVEKLGEGGMGQVFKAHDEKLDRFVALKFLPPSFSTNEEQKARLVQEAQAASAIEDINIATVHDICETPEGNLYVVMGFYEGETLQSRIHRGQLPLTEAIDIARQVAHGLSKAHERNIIHRDIKPGNIFITKDGTIKIIDFGLAKGSFGLTLTRSGTSVGTVAYMSPEQMRGEEVTPATDLWSLGVTLYQMLTGTLPFRGDYETAMMYSITNEIPPPLSSIRQDIPVELEMIVDKAMKKDPQDRYQRASAVADALGSLQKKMDAGIESDTFMAYVNRGVYTATHRYRLQLSIVGVLAAALIGYTIFTMTQHAPESINRSIAVLPFVNLGDSSSGSYIDGLASDVSGDITQLSPNLVLSPTNVSFAARSPKDEDSIASQLGVRFLLEGQVMMSVSSVKLTMKLYDGDRHKAAFTKEYNVNRDDLHSLKTSAIQAVMEILDVPFDPNIFYRHRPPMEVYESYLNGIASSHTSQKDAMRMSREYYTEATRGDSLYLPAFIGLAATEIEEYRQGWDRSENLLTQAGSYCVYILRHDTANAMATAMLGTIADLKGDHTTGIRLLTTSLEKSKNNEYALTMLSWIYTLELNQPEKGVMYLQRQQEFHPLDWMMINNLGIGYGQIKDYPKAIRAFQRAMVLNPTHEWPPYCLAYVYERSGKDDTASLYYERAIRNNPKFVIAYEGLLNVSSATKNYAPAESLLNSGMQQLPGEQKMYYYTGILSLLSGDKTGAIKSWKAGLQLGQSRVAKGEVYGDLLTDIALFQGRLNQMIQARENIRKAIQLDSSAEDVAVKIARCYAVLKDKKEMLEWFHRAKTMNPEYDADYLRTALDFENYRNDPELLSLAHQK